MNLKLADATWHFLSKSSTESVSKSSFIKRLEELKLGNDSTHKIGNSKRACLLNCPDEKFEKPRSEITVKAFQKPPWDFSLGWRTVLERKRRTERRSGQAHLFSVPASAIRSVLRPTDTNERSEVLPTSKFFSKYY